MSGTESRAFVKACALSDIPDNGILSVELNHDEVAIDVVREQREPCGEAFEDHRLTLLQAAGDHREEIYERIKREQDQDGNVGASPAKMVDDA